MTTRSDTSSAEIAIDAPGVRMALPDESRELFDREAQRNLGVSGAAFAQAWQRGEYRGQEERPEVMRVAMLMPGDW